MNYSSQQRHSVSVANGSKQYPYDSSTNVSPTLSAKGPVTSTPLKPANNNTLNVKISMIQQDKELSAEPITGSLGERGRERKKTTIFGTLRKRLSRSKTRNEDTNGTINGSNGLDSPNHDTVPQLRSSNLKSPTGTLTRLGIGGLSRRSSISEMSGMSDTSRLSSISNKTFLHEASTLVLEVIENGLKRWEHWSDFLLWQLSIPQILPRSDERRSEASLAPKGNEIARLQWSHVHCEAFTKVSSIWSFERCSLTLDAFQWLNLWDLHAIDPLPHGQAGLRMSRLPPEVSQAVSRQNTAALSQADHPVDRVVSIPRFLVFSIRDNWRLKSRWRPVAMGQCSRCQLSLFLLLIWCFFFVDVVIIIEIFDIQQSVCFWCFCFKVFNVLNLFLCFRCKMSDNDTAIRKM